MTEQKAVIGSEPADIKVVSPLGKKLAKAFEYHPVGMSELKFVDGWAVGPTFGVKVDEEIGAHVVLTGSIYKDDPYWYTKWTSILSGSPSKAGTDVVELSLSKSGHTRKRETVKTKAGEVRETGPANCTARALVTDDGIAPLEMAFPLYSLVKAVGVTKFLWDIGNGAGVVYGYNKDQELVAVVAPRIPSVYCEI